MHGYYPFKAFVLYYCPFLTSYSLSNGETEGIGFKFYNLGKIG